MRTLLTHGTIYLERNRFCEALLIEDGIIVKTGTTHALIAHAAEADEVMDLGGRTVVPGFNDAHLHLYMTGVALSMVDLYGSSSLEEVLQRGIAFLKEHPHLEGTLIGRGFNQDYFNEKRLPTRWDLDRISTTRPILFYRACTHLAVVNSKALELLSLTGSTPPVEGGVMDKDENGALNGIFRENAIPLLESLLPPVTEERVLDTLHRILPQAHAQGITSVQVNDIWVGNPEAGAVEAGYAALAEEAQLHVYHQIYFKDVASFQERIQTGFHRSTHPFNRYGPLKLFADGSLGARTALLRQPYADDPSTRGIATLSRETLDAFLALAEAEGIQVAIHAIGDGAIDMVLDAFEQHMQPGNPLRHGIIHVQITDKELLQRMKHLNLIAYVQPIFLHYDMHIVKNRVGESLASTSYAFGTMAKLGIPVAYSTDAPIERFHVMENLHAAINRQDLSGFPTGGFYPEEKVDRSTALDSVTRGGAYASFEEERKGRLLPGYVADLVVLSHPYFEVPDDAIKDILVDATMVQGKFVYRRSN